MIAALVLFPTLAGVVTFFLRSPAAQRRLLRLTVSVHFLLTAACWIFPPPEPAPNAWLGLDAPGMLFLTVTSILTLTVGIYAAAFLRREASGAPREYELLRSLPNAPEAVFSGCFQLFLATMTLVIVSRHFGLLWVAMEATTLVSAPLIYFHRSRRSLEATWKYLILCSIGIALALLGNFFLVVASGEGVGLSLSDLLAAAPHCNALWLRTAAIFFFVGYGTKMGFAPLHTWRPDSYSESPTPVAALLSGALVNCAFFALLRVQQVMNAAGQAEFGRELFLGFGLFSILAAAVFVIRQADYKRLLAYSSVEHVGILAVGAGLSQAGLSGSLLHAINHSLVKAMLFMVAGNILAASRTKAIADVRGMLRVVPVSAALWIAGFLAITGSPPFGTFLSEFLILKAAVDQSRFIVAGAYLFLLVAIFIATTQLVPGMAQGEPRESSPAVREHFASIAPPIVLGLLALLLGVYVPPPLTDLLQRSVATLSGGM